MGKNISSPWQKSDISSPCNSPRGFLTCLIDPMTSGETIRIDPERLESRLDALAGVSTTRLAFTPEDRKGRECVIEMMRDAGLDVRIDPATNISAAVVAEPRGPQ